MSQHATLAQASGPPPLARPPVPSLPTTFPSPPPPHHCPTLAQRRAAAELFVHELSWPFAVYVDGMADAFERTFAAWPLRFFLVDADGVTLAHVAQPTSGYTYSVADLRAAVEPLLAPSTR